MSGLVCCAVLRCAALGGAAPATAAPAPATAAPAPATAARAPAAITPAPLSTGATVTARPGPAITATGAVLTVDEISCASVKVCLAVGLEKLSATATATWVTLVWDGNTWVRWAVPAPAPGAHDVVLTGVSCVRGPYCVAVGEYRTAGSPGTTASFAVTWAGGPLKLTPALAQPPQVSAVTVNAVSCVTAKYCVAVGDVFTIPDGVSAMLFETWNGAKWTAVTHVTDASHLGQLDGVSCVTATRCLTVGYLSATTGTITTSAWATLWTVKSFTRLYVPVPAGTSEPFLGAVSCPSVTTCVSTGFDLATIGKSKGLAFTETLNKSTWTLGKVAWPKGINVAGLPSVSCASVRYCIATGSSGYASPASAAAMAYNGTSWSAQVLPPPPAGDVDGLSAVSCAAVLSCVAIGSIGPASGESSNILGGFLTGARWRLATVR
jgi:ferredoxin